MAETLEKLKVEIEADSTKVDTGLNQAKNKFGVFGKNIESTAGSISSSLYSICTSAASAFAVKELVSFGKECVNLASDLTEVQNVVDVTFGDMSGQVNEFAKGAQDRFGMSEKYAKQFTGTMGAMLKSSGLATDQALTMSTNLTGLAGDLASFYNLDVSEAFAKIRSGISGETEPLKQLGINMSVANMEAFALSEGITKSYNSMTQAEQAVLRYNYLISVTSEQQGDFARTSDSWANQTKLLSMRFDELKASIGEGLIPVLEPALELVNGLVSGIGDVVNGIKSVFALASESSGNAMEATIIPSAIVTPSNNTSNSLNNDVSKVSGNLGTAAKNAKGVASGIKDASKAASELKRTVSGFDEANVLADTASGLADTGALSGISKSAGEMATALNTAYDNLNNVNKSAGESKSIFGDVSLSAGQIKDIVAQIAGEGKLAEIAKMTKEMDKLDDLRENLGEAAKTLGTYQWMVRMGFEVSEKDYKKAVDDYAKAANDYVVQQHKVVQFAAQVVFGKGSNEEKEVNSFYAGIEGELSDLSKQIKDKVNEAWKDDGMIDIDEEEEIEKLTSKRQKIINGLNKAEIQANLSNISINYSGVTLSKESYAALMKDLNEQMEKEIKNNQDEINSLKIPLYYQYNNHKITKQQLEEGLAKIDEEYKKLQEETTKKYSKETLKIIAQMDFSLLDHTATSISEIISNSKTKLQKLIDENASEKDIKLNLGAVSMAIQMDIDKLTPEVKEQISTLVSALEPQEKELKSIRDKCLKAGKDVPEYVSNGLSNIAVLKAMNGDVDAIYYLIGTQISDSPKAKEAFKKAQANGAGFSQSFMDGMDGKKVDITKDVQSIVNDAAKAFEGDKSSKEKTKTAGKNTEKQYGSGIKSSNTAAQIAKQKGEEAAKGIVSGTKTMNSNKNKSSLVNSTKNLLDSVTSGARDKLQLKNGSSTLFGTYAGYTVAGYNKKISNANTIQTSKKAVEKWIGEGVIGPAASALIIKSPSRLFGKFGDYTTQGYNNHILANIGDSKKVMAKWGSDIARWGNDYLTQDFGNVANASINGNFTTNITGSIANAVKTAVESQNNTFYATVNIGGEKHVVQFVKQYNQMHGSNPNFGFNM